MHRLLYRCRHPHNPGMVHGPLQHKDPYSHTQTPIMIQASLQVMHRDP